MPVHKFNFSTKLISMFGKIDFYMFSQFDRKKTQEVTWETHKSFLCPESWQKWTKTLLTQCYIKAWL